MRKVVLQLLLSLLASSTVLAAVDTQFMQGLGDTRYHYVESEDIGRGYHIYVRLPDGYDRLSNKKYPTIYLLDGGSLFPLLSAYYRYLNLGDEIPDSIVVGISYGSSSFEGGNYRSTDYTATSPERENWGGAARFQAFLSDELLPLIEDTYPSRVDRRIIFGQSLGGQFVIFSALTRPGLFWGHIASNPALHRNMPFFMEMHADAASTSERSRLFVGSGSLDSPRYRAPALAWIEHWSDKEAPWQLKTEILDGHSHMSAAPASFRQGMRWLFSTD